MKLCPTCNMQLDDQAVFCRNCGTRVAVEEKSTETSYESGYYQAPVMEPTPWDHTPEYEEKDVADHKLMARLVYLTGILGLILALLDRSESAYLEFHKKQGLKLLVTEVVLALASVLLCWTLLVPFACGCALAVLQVIRIICFFRVCGGKSVEPAIVRSLGFLK